MRRPESEESQAAEADRPAAQARQGEPRLADLLAGITPENPPQSFDDRPVGDEAL